jgi:MazG family protein
MDNIDKLLEVMAKLRDPQNGCPWDQRQDFASIAPYTVEEAYEVADAIAREDFAALKDELGDLLFQVVFHARMAEEAGMFEFDDIAGVISEKMLRRHPHVFGSAEERAAGAVAGSWEAIKSAERTDDGDASALVGIAKSLPALKRAQKLGKRAATAGFDWPDRRGVHAKIAEELAELEAAVGSGSTPDIEDELGDLLFAVVNLARHLEVDPEKALTSANYKFERRFRDMETAIMASARELRDLTLASLDMEWRAAKKRVG